MQKAASGSPAPFLSEARSTDLKYEIKARIVRTLANPRRLEIVDILRRGERSVTEISKAVGLTQAGTSQHLAVLRLRGIVEVRRRGNFTYYRLADPAIGRACAMMNDAVVAVLSREQDVVRPILAAARGGR